MDTDELIEALKAKAGKLRPCPVCGHDEWGMGGGTVVLSIDVLAPDEDGATDIDSAWPITCLKCGFIRFFHADTLLEEGISDGGE